MEQKAIYKWRSRFQRGRIGIMRESYSFYPEKLGTLTNCIASELNMGPAQSHENPLLSASGDGTEVPTKQRTEKCFANMRQSMSWHFRSIRNDGCCQLGSLGDPL